MGDAAKRDATYDDLRRVADHLLAQIVDGELIVQPRPAIEHQHVTSVLGGELSYPFGRGRGGPGGWWILDEPELHLRRDIVVPDLAGWRRARVPVLSTGPFLSIAPDWVCEVLSPSTAGLDRVRKLAVYAREQVEHAWLIDPIAHTLEVLRRDGTHWLIVGSHAGGEVVRAEPFDAIELELAALWLTPAPEPILAEAPLE